MLVGWLAADSDKSLQIMKSDEDVRMISAEAPVLFAKVCAITLVHQ